MSPPAPVVQLLGERRFTDHDQQTFAAWSRDCNPMHVDAVAARRLLSGRQVVHGIHTLLWALELWAARGAVGAAWVECSFTQPVSVGDDVVFTLHDDHSGVLRLTASVDGLDCTEISIHLSAVASTSASASAHAAAPGSTPTAAPVLRVVDDLASPLDEPAGSQAGQLLRLHGGDATAMAAAFPQAAAAWGAESLQAVAGLSYFVGMVCPGLHSVFSSASFGLGTAGAAPAPAPLDFTVRKYDPRFKLFSVQFEGALSGTLRAFLRPPPQPQPRAAEVAERVAPDLFRGAPGTQALVIGGSRGLGETTAKILAAGGAQVLITYASGRDDALAVVSDIQAMGRGGCRALHFNLHQADFNKLELDPATLHSVYYFATPRIYAKRGALFDRRIFDEFVDFYLQRFHQLCGWLDAVERSQPMKVYLPSTVFITDRPKGMTEYAMAKAAAEVLVDDLNRSLQNVRIVHSRLPRLATDQTASILKVSVESNLDTLLPVVQAMQA